MEQVTCQLQCSQRTHYGAPHRIQLFAMKLHTATLMSVGVQIELVIKLYFNVYLDQYKAGKT